MLVQNFQKSSLRQLYYKNLGDNATANVWDRNQFVWQINIYMTIIWLQYFIM